MELLLKYQKLLKDVVSFLKAEKKTLCYGKKEEVKRFYSTAIIAKPFLEKTPFILEKSYAYNNPIQKKITKNTQLSKTDNKEQIIKEQIITPKSNYDLLKKTSSDDMQDILKLIQKLQPDFKLLLDPINDKKAKNLRKNFQNNNQTTAICILIEENNKHFSFLQKLSEALKKFFLPCSLINVHFFEKENKWDHFFSNQNVKWLIIEEKFFNSLKNLLSFLKENKEKKSDFLKEIEFIFLSPLFLYSQKPELKKELWKKLCQKLAAYKKT